MKTSTFNLSWKKLGIAITLSLVSLFATNQTALSSEMLDIINARIQRGERTVIQGSPLFDCYTIEGIYFAGVGTDLFCQQMVAHGSAFYDPELNQFLLNACNNPNYGYLVVCPDY